MLVLFIIPRWGVKLLLLQYKKYTADLTQIPGTPKAASETTILQKAQSRGGYAARKWMADLEAEREGEEGMNQEAQLLCPCQSHGWILPCYPLGLPNVFLAFREPSQGAECPALSPVQCDGA